ncbi:MAG: hypothetical protein LUD29_03345 [Clostridia bacterium]|nr:hypothetical protein [Clostridia bacterium]
MCGIEYEHCPKCGLLQMKKGDTLCDTCKADLGIAPDGVNARENFDEIKRGHSYGTSSAEIYAKFCSHLNWDKYQISHFGYKKSLFAVNADTDRTRDVWFLFHYNTVLNPPAVDAAGPSVNFILDSGETIIEKKKTMPWDSYENERIVFVFDKNLGYVFSGVYEYKSSDHDMRLYKRISDVYPVM